MTVTDIFLDFLIVVAVLIVAIRSARWLLWRAGQDDWKGYYIDYQNMEKHRRRYERATRHDS